MNRTTYAVLDMTCHHCTLSVDESVRDLPGIRDVAVDLVSGTLTIAADREIPYDEVSDAVREAGYRLGRQTMADAMADGVVR